MRKSMFGIQQPVGICIVPKYVDLVYQALPKEQWSDYRLKNFELGRPDFDSLHEQKYEKRKDGWIEREQHGQVGYHHEMRYRDGVKLGELPVFQNAPNKKRQRIIARQMFRNMTEQEIDEIVEIARMGISFEDLQVALTGKAVQRPNNGGDMNEGEDSEDAADGEELLDGAGTDEEAEERDVDSELVEQERLVAVAEAQADAEDGLADSWENQDDVNPSSDYDELEYLEVREAEAEREIREWESRAKLEELKGDLGAYNPGSRKLRVKVVPEEPEIQLGILPETKG